MNTLERKSLCLAVTLGLLTASGSALAQPSWTSDPLGELEVNPTSTEVGIGTTSPTSALHVTGSSVDFLPAVTGTQIANGLIELTRSSLPYIDFNEGTLGVDYDARILYNNTSGIDRLSIGGADFYTDQALHVNGSTGMGTTSPSAKLHVVGAILSTGTTGATPVSGAGTRFMWVPAKGALRAGEVTGSQWDNANIGTLSVATGYNTTATGEYSTAMGYTTTAQAYASLVIGRYNAVSGTTNSWVDTEPLLVAGNGTGSGTTSNALTLYKNGNLTIAGNLTTGSDIRLKQEILPVTDVLSKLETIQPVYYTFKNTSTHPAGRQLGFIAQEIQKQWPELVQVNENGYLAVAYGNMSAIAVQAIKEQQQRIVRLEKENAALTARLERLEQMLAPAETKELR